MEKRLDDAWIKFEYFLDGFLYSYEAFKEWRFLMRLSPHIHNKWSIDYERKVFFNWYLSPWEN